MYARPSCLSRKIPATKAGTKRAEEQSLLSDRGVFPFVLSQTFFVLEKISDTSQQELLLVLQLLKMFAQLYTYLL